MARPEEMRMAAQTQQSVLFENLTDKPVSVDFTSSGKISDASSNKSEDFLGNYINELEAPVWML